MTRAIADLLRQSGWQVVFTCIPNTPHLDVVPIPTAHGASKQRYPDILAYRDAITKLVEVEISLNEFVAENIIMRFAEMTEALNMPEVWTPWREKVHRDTGHVLPDIFIPQCDLIICRKLKATDDPLVNLLRQASINVNSADQYQS